jgi:uncharacterized protein (TIGR03000 family)
MYSLLLMTAMAGTPDVAGFGWTVGGCTGVSAGCTGYSYSCSGCYGSSCSGYSYSCSGCTGGPAFPVLGGVVRGAVVGTARLATAPFRLIGNLASCNGCSGYSCSGCSGSSCLGSSCYGSSCLGSSCYGSCYGSTSFGSSCYGSCYGSGVSSFGGCSGVVMPSVSGYDCSPTIIGSATPTTLEHFGTITLNGNSGSTNTIVAAKPTVTVEKASANLTIALPAKAKLYVDGQLIEGDGESRAFHTPELARGQNYYYDVKAVIEINGKSETEEKRIVVKAGDSLKEQFPKLIAAAKNASAPTLASR